MVDSLQTGFTPGELNRLERLRASVADFQSVIAPLAAELQSDAHNEHFNQLRLEARALLRDPDFESKVPRAITEQAWAERTQKTVFPRVSLIVFLGVILVLVGLGVNSVILEDTLINSLGCCVSSGGMLLVLGAFSVWGLTNRRRRVTDLGDLYQRTENLLAQINDVLKTAVPQAPADPDSEYGQIPSVVELSLDSLQKQANDWLEKLGQLKNQELALGAEAPAQLAANIEFVERELAQVQEEIDSLRGAEEPAMPGRVVHSLSSGARVIVPTGARDVTSEDQLAELDSQAIRRARSDTMDMPPLAPEGEEGSGPTGDETRPEEGSGTLDEETPPEERNQD